MQAMNSLRIFGFLVAAGGVPAALACPDRPGECPQPRFTGKALTTSTIARTLGARRGRAMRLPKRFSRCRWCGKLCGLPWPQG